MGPFCLQPPTRSHQEPYSSLPLWPCLPLPWLPLMPSPRLKPKPNPHTIMVVPRMDLIATITKDTTDTMATMDTVHTVDTMDNMDSTDTVDITTNPIPTSPAMATSPPIMPIIDS